MNQGICYPYTFTGAPCFSGKDVDKGPYLISLVIFNVFEIITVTQAIFLRHYWTTSAGVVISTQCLNSANFKVSL